MREMDTLSDLGRTLRDLREARGLSLAQAALRGSLSKSALAHWESGRRTPPALALARLLDALAPPPGARARLLAAADPSGARIVLADAPLGGPVALGDVLRAMRLRRGLSQTDLSRAIDRSQSTLARWERGESEPDPASLHAVLFALSASADEVVAIAALDPDVQPVDDPWHRYESIARGPHELGDTLWLGLEATLWWRASESEAHAALLQTVRLHRADWYTYEERFEESLPLARRAMFMGHRPPSDKPQAGAYGIAWAAIRTGRHQEETALLLSQWAEQAPKSQGRAHILSLRALVLAESSETAAREEAARAVGLAEDAASRWFVDLQLARILMRHDDYEDALETLNPGSDHDLDALTIRAQALSELAEAPPSVWVKAIRARPANRIPLYAQRLQRLERSLAQRSRRTAQKG